MLSVLVVFFGACLLFVVEPMLGKWLLPELGGSPATWAACLAAFQLLLLFGYAYAHAAMRLPARWQGLVHAALCIAAATWVVGVSAGVAPVLDGHAPALAIPWLILKRVGLPYGVLASTAPLLISWTSGARVSDARLYAVSNAGSLAGLLAYPFVIEPRLDVGTQLSSWSAAFCVLTLGLLALCARRWRRLHDPASPTNAGATNIGEVADVAATDTATALRWQQVVRWLIYATLPSALLVAATSYITVDIAATPLFWVVPLALYLVTFMVAFALHGRLRRVPWLLGWAAAAAGVGANGFTQGAAPLAVQLGTTLMALFCGGLLCHAELARERPAARWLTHYYLSIAAGGALGGLLVGGIAPIALNDTYELLITALAVFACLGWRARIRGPSPWSRAEQRTVFVGAGLGVPLLVTAWLLQGSTNLGAGTVIERSRSFLGPLRVVDLPVGRVLTHGRIQHGMQRRGAFRREPTMYFGRDTALATVLERHHRVARRIGVVGLGVGTIAAYGQPSDELRFYELDPAVVDIARRDFTFLADSPAQIEVVVGDGRMALTHEAPHAFDVLVLDAFSSDSVPIHLLTREAFVGYQRQLASNGILLANVSNRHLAVERVVSASAHALGWVVAVVETQGTADGSATHVTWAVMASNETALQAALGPTAARTSIANDVLFTDRRASILSVLR